MDKEESKVYIKIIGEGTTYDCKPENVDDVVQCILEEHFRHDVSMVDLLTFIEIHGLSVNDVVKVYARLHDAADGDQVFRNTGEKIELSDEFLNLSE